MDIANWLRMNGLERYAKAFNDNHVDSAILGTLTAEDLLAMGVTTIGHRRRLLVAIAELSRQPIPTKIEAERRQLTVLYCDMVGSTALSARLDPEDMREVIRAYHGTCTRLVTRYDGYIANFIGDGMLVYFGWPRAHEDDVARAARAGLALVDAVGMLTTPAGEVLAARVGIATGPVVIGDLIHEGPAQEQSAVGETPNLAARMQALAAPRQVVVAESTRRLLAADFSFEDLGARSVKGIGQPVGAFAVFDNRMAPSRFEARAGPALLPMVGREKELALLLDHWTQVKTGNGRGVVLVGEAGIGKSRIARAVLDAVAAEPHVRIRYQCSPSHTDSALWPLIQQLTRAAGLHTGDSVDVSLDKLEALLPWVDGSQRREESSLIATLVGLDGELRYGRIDLTPQMQRARTLEVLVEQLLRLARRKPVLVILEDAHWIDPSTLELMERSLDRIAAARILILVTCRPDNQPNLASPRHATWLTLNRLSHADVEAILARLGGDRLPVETIATIVDHTDGVPLFVEELTKAVLETGETSVPASLHDSLMARLDRIPEVKQVAQIAACIGRDFDHALLTAIADRPAEQLDGSIDTLISAELIFRRGAAPVAGYTFKHALVRDAAYESLLRSTRQRLHRRILETMEGDAVARPPELLAHHAARAGVSAKAIGYWHQAGEAALLKSAYHEAASYFGSAIELVETQSDDKDRHEREFVLQLRLGQARFATQGYSNTSTIRAFDRAYALRSTVRDLTLRVAMFYGVWVGHHSSADFPLGLQLANEFLTAVETEPDDIGRLMANRVVGVSHFIMGEFAEAVRHLKRSLDIYDPERHSGLAAQFGHEPGAAASCYLGWMNCLLGFPDQGIAMLNRAQLLVAAQSNINAQANLHFFCALAAMCYRDPLAVGYHGRLLHELAIEHRLPMWGACAISLQAWNSQELGRAEEAVSGHERGLAEQAAAGALVHAPFFASGLARSLAHCDRVDEALRVIQRAIVESGQTSQHWCAPELWRVRGDLFLSGTRRDSSEAARSFERALSLARSQGARLWELRAATSLARLWAEQGKHAEVRDLLAPVCSWFTEGFDTVDFKDAKALLDN